MRIAPAWMLAATVGLVFGCGTSATRSPDGTGRSQIDVPSKSRRSSEPIRPATAARRPVNPDRFEITALPDTYAEPSPTFWIDDARLVFAALAPDSPLKAEQRVYLRYVWNVLTGRIVQTYGVAERPIWCFSDGYSSYVVHAGREAIMYGGGFGSEAEILRYAVDTPSEQRPRQNEFDCRPSRAGKLNFDPQKGRRLYGDDGYIGRAPQSDVGAPRQLAFYRGNSSDPQPLPIPESEYRGVQYSRYLGAYLLHADGRSAAGEREIAVWKLFPDGRLEKTPVPDGPWTGGAIGFSYGVPGLLMSSHASSAGSAGLYVIRGGDVTQIVAGTIENPHGLPVSPNGCRVALTLSHLPRESPSPQRLHVVDLCTRAK